MLTSSFLFGKGFWVNYGWEIFDYVTSAHVASLGNSTIAYPLETVSGSIINPFIISKNIKKIELSHQSRFAGLVSSDIISGQLDINQRTLFNYNILYEGIGSIPDTRGALMDWGFDGVYGTNDVGENNGKLDEGERLDDSKINYFSQRQIAFHSAFLREINQKKIGIGVKLLHYRLDKNYALAYAGLADCYGQRVIRFEYGEEWIDSALYVADLALKINPNLAEAYKAKGLIHMASHKLNKGENATDKALSLNPGYHTAVANKGVFLSTNTVRPSTVSLNCFSLNMDGTNCK